MTTRVIVAGGGYAEVVAVPEGQLLPVPEGMDLVDAAGVQTLKGHRDAVVALLSQ